MGLIRKAGCGCFFFFLLIGLIAFLAGGGYQVIVSSIGQEKIKQVSSFFSSTKDRAVDFYSSGKLHDVASKTVDLLPKGPEKGAAPEQTTAPEGTPAENGSIQVFFAPTWRLNPLGIDKKLIELIKGARRQICCAFFELELMDVAKALIEKQQQGIAVKIVTDSDYKDRPALKACIDALIPVVFDERKPFMHDKFCIVDNEWVWTGSTNITENCMYYNNNNSVLIDSEKLATDFNQVFVRMFDRHDFGSNSTRNTPYPEVTVGTTRIECRFSPDGGILRKILEEIGSTQQSIDFMAFSFTSKKISKAMAERMTQGVKVRGLFEARDTKSEFCQDDFLEQAGAKVYLDNNPRNMHDKVMILDNKTVITGSYNFSSNAEEDNNENILVIHSPEIAAIYEKEFVSLTSR